MYIAMHVPTIMYIAMHVPKSIAVRKAVMSMQYPYSHLLQKQKQKEQIEKDSTLCRTYPGSLWKLVPLQLLLHIKSPNVIINILKYINYNNNTDSHTVGTQYGTYGTAGTCGTARTYGTNPWPIMLLLCS